MDIIRMIIVAFVDVSMIMVAFINVKTTVVELDVVRMITVAFEDVSIIMARSWASGLPLWREKVS
jgi:hypothetical protein